MPGTADELVLPALMTTEHEVLVHFLNKMRNAVINVSAGLTDAQVRKPGVASGTNLLGLIAHLTWCEEHWFQRVYLGREITSDWSLTAPDGLNRDDAVAADRRAGERSDEIVLGCADLSTLADIPNPDEDLRVPLRVIAAHMIEETGRHAGHADILREQIDGATGL